MIRRRWRQRWRAAVINQSQLRTESKVKPFGLSLWSQRKTNPKTEITKCFHLFLPHLGDSSRRGIVIIIIIIIKYSYWFNGTMTHCIEQNCRQYVDNLLHIGTLSLSPFLFSFFYLGFILLLCVCVCVCVTTILIINVIMDSQYDEH